MSSTLASQDIEIASSRRDAEAAEAVRRHHAQMAGALALRTDALLRAAALGRLPEAEDARGALVSWCTDELVPHAVAEEKAMYPAAQTMPEGRLLVAGMLGEHEVIIGLVREVAESDTPVGAAAAGRALAVVFESHLAKENDLVLPLLVANPEVSVAELLAGMHELLGAGSDHGTGAALDGTSEGAGSAGGCGGACGCGHADDPGYPVLDARSVPHAIRHATIQGALEAVPASGGLVLVAPHDPLPLLAQVEERFDGAFEVSYLERGPEAWRLAFLRRPAG